MSADWTRISLVEPGQDAGRMEVMGTWQPLRLFLLIIFLPRICRGYLQCIYKDFVKKGHHA